MKINDHLYSVGVSNPTLRVFDIIMATQYGTSYNSYLVLGDNKKALIDGSHNGFEETWFRNIEEVTPVDSIDYLIINHTEPDHSGGVCRILERNPDVVIYGTTAALKNLDAIVQCEFNRVTIKGGETLDLGGRTLEFITAPNVHWPDTMLTWCPEEKTLFPCDFLGAHFAEPTGYVDTVYKRELYDGEFLNYYNAIMGPFPNFVRKALDKIKDLDIELIAPSHGPMHRGEDIKIAIDKYKEWSAVKESDKKTVSVIYVSAYGYTRSMSQYLAEKLEEKGLDVYIADVIKTDEAELAAHLGADCLVFGSPTINRAALKPIWDTISSIDTVNSGGKPFATIGCYGWSGEACGQLNERLKGIKMVQVGESVRSRFAPTDDTWKELDNLAAAIAEKLS